MTQPLKRMRDKMRALVLAAYLMSLVNPVAAPGKTIFSDGFEGPRTCWDGAGYVGDFDLCFDMPFDTTPPVEKGTAELSTDVPRADLIIGMDTTGSMGGEIANLKSAATNLIDEFLLKAPDGAVSVAAYDDYHYDKYGSEGDKAFYLLHRSMTVSTAAGRASIIGAIGDLTTHNGGDAPESGWEMVFQVATGAGSGGGDLAVPPFDPTTAPPVPVPPEEEVGGVGGVGIRGGSMPILIWITDAESHNSAVTQNFYQSIPGVSPSSSAQALAAINSIGGRIIGVMSAEAARPDLIHAAVETRAVVEPEDWGADSRPPGCAITQCCTGVNGTGVLAVSGRCPLVFEISADGAGLGTAVTEGIQKLLTSGSSDISADLVMDLDDDIDSVSAFVERVVADDTAPPPCTQGLNAIDTNADSVPDTFTGVTPGSIVCFEVELKTNQTVASTAAPQYFSANLDIIADGVTVLETRGVHFRVPGS